ncbi:MAG: geranylgeranyl pyrophosphate synthase [Elusimicrobia bacterium]|nr:MAG: geranylgeranyl pyrophosphate synthase [Elusimicrobiota bacterium]KAF0154339.1 MAG: geranylgeranyl pyrophosphate synthase [Elusimicrobiota bacterium]
MDILSYMGPRARLADKALVSAVKALPFVHPPLRAAMLYTLRAGGKRIRSVLLGASYELFGGRYRDVLPAACALEMVHTYSLVHDDLPAMDDDDLRRGKPACHKVFGEAGAILAGDALLTSAFTVLAGDAIRYGVPLPAGRVLKAAAILAARAGASGMVAGQSADLEAEGFLSKKGAPGARAARLLGYIHLHKTADLIAASLEMGAALAGASGREYRALSGFGLKLGLVFQAADDILDVVGDKRKLGKSGSDARNKKLTYTSLYGVEGARRRLRSLAAQAKSKLRPFGRRAGVFYALTDFFAERDR